MIVLVCGGRDFTDDVLLEHVLDQLHEEHCFTKLIHGGAYGADTLAGTWAHWRGVPKKVYRAQWEKHGKAAGPIRNQRMLDESKPDLVVAFEGRVGTADMVSKAKKVGIAVITVNKKGARP